MLSKPRSYWVLCISPRREKWFGMKLAVCKARLEGVCMRSSISNTKILFFCTFGFLSLWWFEITFTNKNSIWHLLNDVLMTGDRLAYIGQTWVVPLLTHGFFGCFLFPRMQNLSLHFKCSFDTSVRRQHCSHRRLQATLLHTNLGWGQMDHVVLGGRMKEAWMRQSQPTAQGHVRVVLSSDRILTTHTHLQTHTLG